MADAQDVSMRVQATLILLRCLVRAPWRAPPHPGRIATAMETRRARLIAERLHADDREEDGMPLVWHVRRVARRTPPEARSVAWLHEVLEFTTISEQELLADGLTDDELRAIRLLKSHGGHALTWRLSRAH